MHKSRIQYYTVFGISLVLSLATMGFVGCGGSSNPTTATNGTVNASMTDPLTCGSEFPDIYVTVTKVKANVNANAGPNSSGWQTIVDLTKDPMQIDLAKLNPTNTCLLKKLGSSSSLPAGKYQQIRLYLLSNSTATNSSDACGSHGWNCVVTDSGQTEELQLPSEVQTGIKIPSPNITSGGLTVTAGQSVDLNIDFQSCESIVPEGNGMYRLKPVLFAGEVSPNMNSISGQVVEGNSSGQPLLNSSNQATPIAGATVLFEHPDTNGNEVVMESTKTDQSGNFFLCPLSGNNYDIVVTAQTSGTLGTTTYNPTVAFNVPLGTKLSQIPLVPETVSTASTGGAATLQGQVDTSPTTSDGTAVTLMPTMSISSGSATDSVVIPVFTVNGTTVLASGQPPSVTTGTVSNPTASNPACSAGSDCYNFMLTVPASDPNVGTFSSGSITYGVQSSSSVTYSLTASAPDSCSTKGTDTASSLVVTPDQSTKLSSNLTLSGCS